ncbi:hypothetical protein HMPREF0080_01220 [Anaeroglobus geminatus F0357]|uniref:Uncharacterized protein n=1 Tax=Anaeroglobus geminatus F0357 TaxID=861450 RepID=G9YHT7_9FIRM|nr:hypothetical protein HMPREF0080_01220 [Anaeroglobus geminatus F0357]
MNGGKGLHEFFFICRKTDRHIAAVHKDLKNLGNTLGRPAVSADEIELIINPLFVYMRVKA